MGRRPRRSTRFPYTTLCRARERTSHKKACVALARKLAVILHRMLITGEAFRWPEKEATTTA